MKNCIYVGNIMHMRLVPKKHKFNYSVFSLFLDLDFIDNKKNHFKLLKLISKITVLITEVPASIER